MSRFPKRSCVSLGTALHRDALGAEPPSIKWLGQLAAPELALPFHTQVPSCPGVLNHLNQSQAYPKRSKDS